MQKYDDESSPLVGSRQEYQQKDQRGKKRSNGSGDGTCATTELSLSLFALVLLTSMVLAVIVGLVRFVTSRASAPSPPVLMQTQGEVRLAVPSESQDKNAVPPPYTFPSKFVWGAATSSYQIEGAVHEDSRGPSIWDLFCKQNGTIMDGSNGDVACDHYHRVEDDVAIMKSMNLKAYRFSISWSRIIPDGMGAVNPKGIAFYNHLIDTLLQNGIEPWATLYHWDLPEHLCTNYGGWLNRNYTVTAFGEYARVCFQAYGDRVKRWITLNEPWTVAVNGHGTGIHAPGHISDTEPYIVGHNLLLAHATAAKIYRTEFVVSQQGLVGIANCGDFRYPLTLGDYGAAERAILFQFGWFTEPFFYGQYPTDMQKRLGSRLPQWTEEDRELVLGSTDFVGLNYYSSLLAATPAHEASWSGYWADVFVDFDSHPDWRKNDMGWANVPDGLREMLFWVSNRYGRPLIFVTENGSAEPEPNSTVARSDEKRRMFFEGHTRACAQAIEGGVDLRGYFAWSLMDNFEWQFGYQRRFGLYRVDFDSKERTPKSSALWYGRTIATHGRNIPRKDRVSWFP
ncbi:hypothetical protein ACA910_004304 [Epithemia clementina (nom. ined.)]